MVRCSVEGSRSRASSSGSQPMASATALSQSTRTSHSPSRYCGTSISLVYSQQSARVWRMRASLISRTLMLPASAALYVGNARVIPGFRINCRRPTVELTNTAIAFASSGDSPVTGIQPLPTYFSLSAVQARRDVLLRWPAVISRYPAFSRIWLASG